MYGDGHDNYKILQLLTNDIAVWWVWVWILNEFRNTIVIRCRPAVLSLSCFCSHLQMSVFLLTSCCCSVELGGCEGCGEVKRRCVVRPHRVQISSAAVTEGDTDDLSDGQVGHGAQCSQGSVDWRHRGTEGSRQGDTRRQTTNQWWSQERDSWWNLQETVSTFWQFEQAGLAQPTLLQVNSTGSLNPAELGFCRQKPVSARHAV